jgi:hypothetical protein
MEARRLLLQELISSLGKLDADGDGLLSAAECTELINGTFHGEETEQSSYVQLLIKKLVSPRNLKDIEVIRMFQELDVSNCGQIRVEDFVYGFLHMTEFSMVWDRHLLLRIEQFLKKIFESQSNQSSLRRMQVPDLALNPNGATTNGATTNGHGGHEQTVLHPDDLNFVPEHLRDGKRLLGTSPTSGTSGGVGAGSMHRAVPEFPARTEEGVDHSVTDCFHGALRIHPATLEDLAPLRAGINENAAAIAALRGEVREMFGFVQDALKERVLSA